MKVSTHHHGSTSWHKTSDNNDGVVGVVRILIVEDAEPKPLLPLHQGDLLHLGWPGGRIREDLQGSGPESLSKIELRNLNCKNFNFNQNMYYNQLLIHSTKLGVLSNWNSQIDQQEDVNLLKVLWNAFLGAFYIPVGQINIWKLENYF